MRNSYNSMRSMNMPILLFLFTTLLRSYMAKAYTIGKMKAAPLLFGCKTRHGSRQFSQHYHTFCDRSSISNCKISDSSNGLTICKSHEGDGDTNEGKDAENNSNINYNAREVDGDFHDVYKEDFGDKRDEDEQKFLDDISWRTEKMRLEEANTRSFLKSRPRKLPYEEARRWVQANLGADTAEEFYDLVENGNLRTPYIPKRPEEYYMQSGSWISWDHFLRVSVFEEDKLKENGPKDDSVDSSSSPLPPDVGVFD